MYNFQRKEYNDLRKDELFDILKLRQDVFIVEQKSIYYDIDEYDKIAHHVLLYENEKLIAYGRILPSNTKNKNPSLTRLLIANTARSNGIGTELIEFCINETKQMFPTLSILISAQVYLEQYYQKFGFKKISDAYDDGGIMHFDMKLN